MRWPDFSDYSQHVRKFYELNGNSLWWVQGMEPTPEARQLIALMLQADQKGPSAEDYDGPRWTGRLAKLKSLAQQPAEALERYRAILLFALSRDCVGVGHLSQG